MDGEFNMDQIKLIEALEADVQMHMRVAVKAIDAKVALVATVEGQAKRIAELEALIEASKKQEAVAWAVTACSKMFKGEFAEFDAKAEARHCGGTCVAYALYKAPVVAPDVLKDAERYRWLREYLPSDDMSVDDALVAALNPQEIDAVIDAARGSAA